MSQYKLLYHPSIPGRGEFVRLALRAAKQPFSDVANERKDGYDQVLALATPQKTVGSHFPIFAPPALLVPRPATDGGDLLISQTPNILLYIGEKHGLGGRTDDERYRVHALALTSLDLANEAHDTHHPIAASQYYEDQKSEAIKKAKSFLEERIPKFLGHFQQVIEWNSKHSEGSHHLVGTSLTYADTTLWQVLDGLKFAFPRQIAHCKADYPTLWKWFDHLKGESWLKEYLESSERLKYGDGIFRNYPELDKQ